MSLEQGPQRKQDEPKDPGRRKFLIAGAGALAAGALGIGAEQLGESAMDRYRERASEKVKQESDLTLKGIAHVLNKFETTEEGKPLDNALEWLPTGILPAIVEGIAAASGNRDKKHFFFLIKIEGREPVVAPVNQSIYEHTQPGEVVSVEYVTDAENKNVRIKNLQPIQ